MSRWLVVAAAVVVAAACAVCAAAEVSREQSVYVTRADGTRTAVTVNVVATGFTWAENLAFDGAGSLFVSELMRGELYRITPNGDGTYTQTQVTHGLGKILGLAVDPTTNTTLYAAGRLPAPNSTDCIFRFNTAGPLPLAYDVVALMPSGCVPNGFGMDHSTGLLYASCEGNWASETGGAVHEIDPATGALTNLWPAGLWAADGLWIDQSTRRLYVGELVPGRMWAWDLAARADLGLMPGGGLMMDDFTLGGTTALQNTFFACEWVAGTIVNFAVNSSDVTTFVSGLSHPTSARFGFGPGFAESSLFITEGGGVFPFQTSDRVLEVPNAQHLLRDLTGAALPHTQPAPSPAWLKRALAPDHLTTQQLSADAATQRYAEVHAADRH